MIVFFSLSPVYLFRPYCMQLRYDCEHTMSSMVTCFELDIFCLYIPIQFRKHPRNLHKGFLNNMQFRTHPYKYGLSCPKCRSSQTNLSSLYIQYYNILYTSNFIAIIAICSSSLAKKISNNPFSMHVKLSSCLNYVQIKLDFVYLPSSVVKNLQLYRVDKHVYSLKTHKRNRNC